MGDAALRIYRKHAGGDALQNCFNMTATLFQGSGTGVPVATTGVCAALPQFTGAVAIGTVVSNSCTFSVLFAAGDTGYVQISATSASGGGSLDVNGTVGLLVAGAGTGGIIAIS